MRDVLRRMARANRPHLHTLTPEQARAAYEAGAGVLEIASKALPRVEDIAIPARDGTQLHARLYAPSTAQPLPVLLYLHGGGFTIGSVATHDTLCRELAFQAGCAVVSLTAGLRRSTSSPPPSTTPGMRCSGCTSKARRWGWTAAAWPWAATAPVARWQLPVRCWHAMPGCPCSCSC